MYGYINIWLHKYCSWHLSCCFLSTLVLFSGSDYMIHKWVIIPGKEARSQWQYVSVYFRSISLYCLRRPRTLVPDRLQVQVSVPPLTSWGMLFSLRASVALFLLGLLWGLNEPPLVSRGMGPEHEAVSCMRPRGRWRHFSRFLDPCSPRRFSLFPSLINTVVH